MIPSSDVPQRKTASPNTSSTSSAVSSPPKRIGDLLLAEGLIQKSQLSQALQEAQATKQPLGSVLIKLGYLSEKQLGRTLARLHEIEYIEGTHIRLQPELMELLPEAFIRQNIVVPLALDKQTGRMAVIMTRPDQYAVLDEIAGITGYRPVAKLSTHSELVELIAQYYMQHTGTSREEAIAQLEEDLSSDTSIFSLGIGSELEQEMTDSDAPTVQLVNSILEEAIRLGASDVHIEPQKERLLIRYRIDGILKEAKSLPKTFSSPVVSRVKVASGMDIAEKRRPQDGRMKILYGSNQIDMRVNTLSIQFGEKIVIRILKPNATSGGLEKLGLDAENAKKLRRLVSSPNGIILVTGPTGSGKTTTLYSCLRELNTMDRNITTIEDPIEYPIAGINQTQVSQKAGLTFALCLRAILRQDPDVILVGEIRDHETLEAAIHAALTGHLVFSTIHTNSAAKTLTRLLEMQAKPYLISSSVIGIVAQRLVRQLCPHCKIPVSPSRDVCKLLKLPENTPEVIYEPGGCSKCGQSGYKGRMGLYEIMPLSRELQTMVEAGAPINAIEDLAVQLGMKTLAAGGREHILSGLTSIDEVARVIGADALED